MIVFQFGRQYIEYKACEMQHKRLNSRNWFHNIVYYEKIIAYTSGSYNHRDGRIAVSRPSFTIGEQ